MNYALKDASTAVRTPLTIDPISDEQITACREVLIANGASDLVDMLGVSL